MLLFLLLLMLRVIVVNARTQAYLFQVRVTPRFPISKDPRHDSPLAVVVHLLTSGPSLDAGNLTSGGVGDVDRHQLATGQPERRVPRCVVSDPQEKFPVVIIDLFRLGGPIKVH